LERLRRPKSDDYYIGYMAGLAAMKKESD
jgi:hypothetical protein